MSILYKLTRISYFVWLCSIPWSVAYHYNRQAGIVHGIPVDYRIPSIAVSALLLAGFLFGNYLLLQRWKEPPIIFILQLRSFLSTHTSQGGIALFCSMALQTIFALYQVVFQHSVTGYLPFGEVDFHSPLIAKGTSLSGALYKLPYGTTPHPNVLAGYFVMSALCILLLQPSRKWMGFAAILLAFLVCLFTQSWSAMVALLLFLGLSAIRNVPQLISFSRICVLLLPLGTALFFSMPSLQQTTNTSLARRASLQTIANHMIVSKPFGVGWNNFTLYMENYGYVGGELRFLQPVHNVFMLLVTELGLLGISIWILWSLILLKWSKQSLLLLGPLTVLASWDHYLLSLNPGRMILVLCLFTLLAKKKPQQGYIEV